MAITKCKECRVKTANRAGGLCSVCFRILGKEDVKESQVLRDLRHVYKRPKEEDKTPGQKALRELYKKDVKGFIAMYQKEEASAREQKERKEAKPVGVAVVADEGRDRSIELYDRLIQEAANVTVDAR